MRASLTDLRHQLDQARAFLERLGNTVEALEEAVRHLPASNDATLATVDEPSPVSSGLQGALLQGEALKAQWVRDGTLVPSGAMSQAWGITPQALQQAVARGELFSMKMAGKTYYLAALRSLDREVTGMVCRALGNVEPSGQLVFWLRTHGALAGKTVPQALARGQLRRVLHLARAWADEHAEDRADGEEPVASQA
jgi:hypothetical protein